MMGVATVILATAGWTAIIAFTDPSAQLAAMGLNQAQTNMVGDMTSAQKPAQYTSTAVMGVLALGYMVWCRKFYTAAPPATIVTPA